jgi:hypothetical protein
LEYQTLGEPERSLVEERRGEVMLEDMSMDELIRQGQQPSLLLIRLDTSTPVIPRNPIRLVPNSIATTLYPGSVFYGGITQSAVSASAIRSKKVPEQPTSPRLLLIRPTMTSKQVPYAIGW